MLKVISRNSETFKCPKKNKVKKVYSIKFSCSYTENNKTDILRVRSKRKKELL
jgi:hypothetical protein